MLRIVIAPSEAYFAEKSWVPSVFLAGGITNCPDWQSELIKKFEDREASIQQSLFKNALSLTVYNPRRENFPINDPTASETQIGWEYEHLKNSDVLVFWFSKGSLNPIVLYELGRWGNSSDKPIVVGCDPEYSRIKDVEIQTALSRPGLIVHDNLDTLFEECVRKIEKINKLYKEFSFIANI